jgi:hypothetical protein
MFSDDSGGGDFGDRTTAKGVAGDVAASLSTEAASALFVEAILQLS